MIYGDKEYKDGEVKMPSMEAIMQSSNLYVYCMNKPLMYVDPSGRLTVAVGGYGAAAFVVKAGVSSQYVIDDNKNVGIIITVQGGGGTPTANAGGVVTITNADKITNLKGLGGEGGGSLWAGAELVIGKGYQGINFSFGFSTPLPELHGEGTYSWVRILIGDKAEEAKNKIIVEINKLSTEDKKKIEEQLGISFDDLRE
jgi:hypothetical protein